MIPIQLGLIPIPIPGFTKIHDSDSNSDSSSCWFWFQCFPIKLWFRFQHHVSRFQFQFQQTKLWFRFWFRNLIPVPESFTTLILFSHTIRTGQTVFHWNLYAFASHGRVLLDLSVAAASTLICQSHSRYAALLLTKYCYKTLFTVAICSADNTASDITLLRNWLGERCFYGVHKELRIINYYNNNLMFPHGAP